PRRAGRAVRPRRAVRRQHELRDPLRLPDEPARALRRRLQVQRLPPRRRPADADHLARLLDRPAAALRPLTPRAPPRRPGSRGELDRVPPPGHTARHERPELPSSRPRPLVATPTTGEGSARRVSPGRSKRETD